MMECEFQVTDCILDIVDYLHLFNLKIQNLILPLFQVLYPSSMCLTEIKSASLFADHLNFIRLHLISELRS